MELSPCFKYRVSHETWQLVNDLKCLLPKFFKLFDTKENNEKFDMASYYSKIDFKVKFI